MPKDVSSSSGEEEAESSPPEPVSGPTESQTARRYRSPDDFVTFRHRPCSRTLTSSLTHNHQLWLVKAPISFNPDSLRGVKVPLAGLQTLEVPGGDGGVQQIYSVMASDRGTADLRLLSADQTPSDAMTLGPAFSGLLNVFERHGAAAANREPRVLPAAAAPAVPPGLRQRFHPFGSKTPTLTYVAENEADGAAFGPSSATLRPLVVKRFVEDGGNGEEEEEEEEERRKRKKKKKEKRIKTEPLEVKQEPESQDEPPPPMMMMMMDHDEEEEERRRRRKKKKKDREREEVEAGLEPSVRVKVELVKSEPDDTLPCSAKKKKKKKKSKMEDD